MSYLFESPITLSSLMSFMDNPNDTNPDTVKFSNTQTLHGILTCIELFTSYIYIRVGQKNEATDSWP